MVRKRTGKEKWLRPPGTATVGLLFRFTEEEAARIRAAGAECGPTVTEWGRQVLLEAVEKHEAQRSETP